jgi:hypothetical protein
LLDIAPDRFQLLIHLQAGGKQGVFMRASLREKAMAVCETKIAQKGEGVGLSFYAFFANRNDDPELLMEAATWWISIHRLDHFEKAARIRRLLLDQL